MITKLLISLSLILTFQSLAHAQSGPSEVLIDNGDLTDIRSITEKNGTCGLVRYALAVPAAIYGAAVPGNTFRCKF